MLTLIVVFVVLYAVVALLVTAFSMWFQPRIYTDATEGLEWRGPAAAGVILAPVLVWLLMARASPDSYRPMWDSTSRETAPALPRLFIPDEQGKLQMYGHMAGSSGTYRLNGRSSGPPLPSRPRWIVIEESGQRTTFKPETDEQGNLLIRKATAFAATTSEPLRYVDDKGRIMLEGSLGRLTIYKTGVFMVNLLLNLLLLASCFAGLWALVRFQWLHALGFAVVLWLLMLLFVMPPALTQVEATIPRKPAQSGCVRLGPHLC